MKNILIALSLALAFNASATEPDFQDAPRRVSHRICTGKTLPRIAITCATLVFIHVLLAMPPEMPFTCDCDYDGDVIYSVRLPRKKFPEMCAKFCGRAWSRKSSPVKEEESVSLTNPQIEYINDPK